MASTTSASSSQSQNPSNNTSTVAGSATTTITVGNFSGLQAYGVITIGGADYSTTGPTSMSQGSSWSYSGSRLYTHGTDGTRGAVGVSARFYVSGTTFHPSSATATTQPALDYNRSANAPYYDNITRTSSTNIYASFARTGSVNGPTTYVLERATNSAMTENYTTFSEGNQTVVSTTNYFFRMYAYGDEGGNKFSGVYGPYNGVPTAPTNVVGTASTSVAGRITVSWTAPSATNGGITNYYVTRNGQFVGQTGSATTSYIDNGLTKGTNYTYTISAENATGTSVASSPSTATQAPGTPYAPTLNTVTASTNTFGMVSLAWSAPSVAVGTMQNYLMYAVFNGNIEKTVSTGTNVTSGSITGLDERKVYTFYVRGRNQFSINNGIPGDQSNTINRKSPGPPSAPTSLTANAPFFPPGTVDLSWTAPSDVGTEGGTITGYSVYLAGQSVPIKTTTGTGTTTTITDLIPATAYTFNVRARNAIADIVGTFSVASSSVTATAQGEPDAPTNLIVVPDPVVAGRLVLTWTPPVGYNTGFRVYTGAGVLVANIAVPRLEIDGLTPNTSFSYRVRARNPLTDMTGAEGGAFSATVSGFVGASSTQTVPSLSVTNDTNSSFVGTYNIISTTSATMTYSKTASNIPFASVPVSGGSTSNNTNTNLNGTYTVTAVGTQATSTAVTYAKSGSDIPISTSTPSGTMYNNTNHILSGNYVVLASPAPDPVLKTVSYAKIGSNITSRGASGGITNNSNATYNGEYTISNVTETSIIFPKTSANIEESDAFGIVRNKTNKDIFNGTYTITDTPDHKTVEYSTGDLTYSENIITNPSFETVQSGTTVLRTNLISNPSFDTNVTGWSGTNASIVRSSDVSKFGTHSALVSPSSNTGSVSNGVTISSAGDYTLSAWVYAPEDKNIQVISGSTFEVPADTWTRISSTVTLSSGSTSIGFASVDSTIPFYVDGVLLEAGTTLKPYFDGATADELGWNYEWTGTAHASTSTAKAASGAGVVGYTPTPAGTVLSHTFSTYRSGTGSLNVTSNTTSSVRNDTLFLSNIGTGPNSRVTVIHPDSNGNVYVGGGFTTWDGLSSGRGFVRLNSSGVRDTAFSTAVGIGPDLGGGGPQGVAIQSDGKIIVVGGFSSWDFVAVNSIVRLNSNGTRDTAFTVNTGAGAGGSGNVFPEAVALQSDGKILVGGRFTLWNGVSVNRLVRLNSDGTADTVFNSNLGTGFNDVVLDVAVQPDGKIIVVGQFSQFNGTTVGRVVRLNSDGSLDTTFMTAMGSGANNYLTTVLLYADGRIILAGEFSSFSGIGTRKAIVRLNSDGTLDTAFSSNVSPSGQGFNSSIESAVLQSDGKIVVGGIFTLWGSTTVNRVARINPDGTKDMAFISAIGTGANDRVCDLNILPNQKILFGGDFTSWNGTNTRLMQIEPYQIGTSGGVSTTVSVSSGSTYTFSGWIYSEEAISVVATATNPTTTSSTFNIPANTWSRVSVTFTANSTTTNLSVTSTQSVNFYVDDFMLQESSTLQDYFDGDLDATAVTWPMVYTWEGTPHASVSIREVGGTLPGTGAGILAPYGEASRVDSEAQLQIRYRSGWIG